MAYTSLVDKWLMIDPMQREMIYAREKEAAEKEDRETLSKYLETYYAAPEILLRSETYKNLGNSIGERLNELSSMIADGSYTHGDFKRKNSFLLLADLAKYKRGVEKAKLLSLLILELRKAGPNAVFSHVYTEDDLDNIDENSTYTTENLSDYQTLGAKLGAQVSASAEPTVVKNILGGSAALIHNGYSYSQAMEALADESSPLAQLFKSILDSSNIKTPEALERFKEAVMKGFLGGLQESYTTMNIPKLTTSALERKQLEMYEKNEAMQHFIETGDYSSLKKYYPIVPPTIIDDGEGGTKQVVKIGTQIYEILEDGTVQMYLKPTRNNKEHSDKISTQIVAYDDKTLDKWKVVDSLSGEQLNPNDSSITNTNRNIRMPAQTRVYTTKSGVKLTLKLKKLIVKGAAPNIEVIGAIYEDSNEVGNKSTQRIINAINKLLADSTSTLGVNLTGQTPNVNK